AQARLSALAQFAEFCPGLGLHDFLSLRPDTQRHVLLTPEYGQWASWMKRRLVARNPQADGPRAEDLRRQFQYFLLAGYLRQPGPVNLELPLVEGCFVPLVGSACFLKLGNSSPADRSCRRCTFDGTSLVFEEGDTVSTRAFEQPGEAMITYTLSDLSNGVHRLPVLKNHSTVIGMPVSTYYKACLRGMSGTAEETQQLRYPKHVEAAWREISEAVALLSNSWPEMGLALGLHAKVVVPLESDTVLSYSESATPNVLFVRARPMNPLWYLELLVHECSHTWLS